MEYRELAAARITWHCVFYICQQSSGVRGSCTSASTFRGYHKPRVSKVGCSAPGGPSCSLEWGNAIRNCRDEGIGGWETYLGGGGGGGIGDPVIGCSHSSLVPMQHAKNCVDGELGLMNQSLVPQHWGVWLLHISRYMKLYQHWKPSSTAKPTPPPPQPLPPQLLNRTHC